MDVIHGSIDLTRIVFLLGAILALLYKKKLGITPGGIIVPGTLAVVLSGSFIAFIISITSALACWLIYKIVFGHYALSGRWASLVTISLSVLIGLALVAFTEVYQVLDQEQLLLSLIIPGLVSISARKYGIQKVMFGTLSIVAVVTALGWALALVIPYHLLSYLSVELAAFTPLTLVNPYIVLPISLATAVLVYYKFGIRGGGYLIAPFLAAVIVTSPIQAALLAVGVALSYFIVTLLQRFTLIIGLERFVASLFCGYLVVSVIDSLAIHFHILGYRPAALVLIIAVAVLTNDLSLQPVRKTLQKGFAPTMLISYLTRLAV